MRKGTEKRLRIAAFSMLFCIVFSHDVPGTEPSIVDYDPTSKAHWLSTDFGSSVTHGTDSAAYGYGANASGDNASVFGPSAEATGSYAAAFAAYAKAYMDYSLAWGYSATVGTSDADSKGASGIAIGNESNTVKDYGISIGARATASGANAIAIGSSEKKQTQAAGASAVAIGNEANAASHYGVAIGYKAAAKTKDYAIAIGNQSISYGLQASVLGNQAKAYTEYAVALGNSATVGTSDADSKGASGIAIGNESNTVKDYGISIGARATASGANAIAIGSSEKKQTQAAGASAVAIGNEANAASHYGVAIGYKAAAKTKDYAIAIGNQSISYGLKASVLGNQAEAYADYSVAFGVQAVVGASGRTDGHSGVAIGYQAQSTKNNGIALGANALADALDSVAIGANSVASEANSVSVGASTASTRTITNVTKGDSTKDAANWDQIAETGQTFTINSTNNVADIVANDGTSLAKITIAKGSVSFGNTGFVDGGSVFTAIENAKSAMVENVTTSTAAITGKMTAEKGHYIQAGDQVAGNLKALDDAIGEIEEAGNVIKKTNGDDGTFVSVADNLKNIDNQIGKIAKMDGSGQAISYTAIQADNSISDNLVALDKAIGDGVAVDLTEIKEKTLYDKAKAGGTDAIALGNQSDSSGATGGNAIAFGTNASATKENAVAIGRQSEAGGANSVALGNGAEASGEDSVAIGSGAVAKEANVVSVGSEESERRIVHVADGVNDTDAVNVSQLNRSFANMQNEITSNINRVGAGAAALAALHPEGFNPADKVSFAVGYGHYRSANAGAFGVFYKPNADTTFSLGGTLGNGDPMMSAGVSFRLGIASWNREKYSDTAAVLRELASLRKNNDKLSADNKTLKQENAVQARRIETLEADNAKQGKEIEHLKSDNEIMKKQMAKILAKVEID